MKMNNIDRRAFEILKCQRLFPLFAKAVQPRIVFTDFHVKYYRILHRFAKGKIKRLIITIPPQHGKSEGSTRMLPAFMFGLNPDLKIAIASYSDTFAKRFNRDVQRIIDNNIYSEIFQNTKLNSRSVVTAIAPLRNSSDFEIVGHTGSLKAVGRGGSLTGNQVDVMIMDDLYSNAMEGNSPTIRDAVWEWYISVVKTRLHNDSQELIVFTRWHEDDLIGRLEQKEIVKTINSFNDIDPGFEGWYKINFEAIKESDMTELDQRAYGEPLWPQRHNIKLLNEKRALDTHSFDCMYQGNPSSAEGYLYSRFETYDMDNMPVIVKKANYTDTADMGDDMLCSICYDVGKDGNIYITDILYTDAPMEQTEPQVSEMLAKNDTKIAYIESNNGGRGFARNVQRLSPNVSINWFNQSGNKESRVLTNSASVQHNILFPKNWEKIWPIFYQNIVTFKREFRANKHDDAPDTLTGIIEMEINRNKARGIHTAEFNFNDKKR